MRRRLRLVTVISLVVCATAAGPAAVAQPSPPETHDCCTVELGFVPTASGGQVRTIVTRPKAVESPAPAVLFVAWLSCDSVALQSGATDGWSEFQRRLVRETGAVVMRVDKPGVGDSDGDCASTDFAAELDAYRRALDALKARPDVDRNAMAIVGGSAGGVIAPLLAGNEAVRAVAVWGTVAKTWLEHMVELERRRLTLAGHPPQTVDRMMRALIEFHTRMLTASMTPRQVIAAAPRLADVWYGEPDGLYGRPAAYFHQVHALDLLSAWQKVEAPVLAVHGEYDWIMSRSDHQSIVDVVNAARPGTARFVPVPRTDHHFTAFESPEAAFRDEGGRVSVEAIAPIVDFLREHLSGGGAARPAATGADAKPSVHRDLFTPLIGNWNVTVEYMPRSGPRVSATGTWHFERTLEDRAVQDVWRVSTPERDPLGYGMTVRFYDPRIDAWRATWHGVLTGDVSSFVARRQGTDIVMEREDDGERTRWIFSDMTDRSFRWRAESSTDYGRTWLVEQRMQARRAEPAR